MSVILQINGEDNFRKKCQQVCTSDFRNPFSQKFVATLWNIGQNAVPLICMQLLGRRRRGGFGGVRGAAGRRPSAGRPLGGRQGAGDHKVGE